MGELYLPSKSAAFVGGLAETGQKVLVIGDGTKIENAPYEGLQGFLLVQNGKLFLKDGNDNETDVAYMIEIPLAKVKILTWTDFGWVLVLQGWVAPSILMGSSSKVGDL